MPIAIWGCGGAGGGGASGGVAPVGNVSPAFVMTTSRADHSATTLGSGKVLIAGGIKGENVGDMLASAEIYDPANPGFTPTGAMATQREGQTATLLPNGTVLIAGGIRNFGYRETLRSAEIYDPGSGTFKPTADMAHHRQGHTATLLRDGRVLIAGGQGDGPESLSSAELYDPALGGFASAGHMNYQRTAHAASLLSNGQVLITGGAEAGGPEGAITLQNSEVYDPSSRSFINVGRMRWQRFGQSSTLLSNGTVLIAGGRRFTGLYSAELYNPENRSFQETGNMMVPHYLHTATLLSNGKVLIAGGWDGTGPSPVGMKDAELYDPVAGTFSETSNMNTARLDQTANLLPDGRVLMAGGIDGNGNVTATCEIYNPATGFFVVGGGPGQLPAARSGN
jgi:hypothetical protein